MCVVKYPKTKIVSIRRPRLTVSIYNADRIFKNILRNIVLRMVFFVQIIPVKPFLAKLMSGGPRCYLFRQPPIGKVA